MTLRRLDATETRKGMEQTVYLLGYEWGETVTDCEPGFFRTVIESLAFQRALELLDPALVQLAPAGEGGYCLRVLTPRCEGLMPDGFTV
ncbi:MAG: hypothetical protein H7Z41_13670 [Cytophagales bacterium]|nr:hypothetical protein [Armatimonadota bacterium]